MFHSRGQTAKLYIYIYIYMCVCVCVCVCVCARARVCVTPLPNSRMRNLRVNHFFLGRYKPTMV